MNHAMPELISSQQQLTSQELQAFASGFSVDLPDAFTAHYLRVNGGVVAETDAEAGVWGLPINGFNAIKYGSLTIECLIDDVREIYPEDGSLCWHYKEFIPFAYDCGGNMLFMSLKDNDYSAVYLYAPDGENIVLVAPSFQSFINRLYKQD